MSRSVLRSLRAGLVGLAAFAGATAVASAALAHHSFAMFDKEHPVELQGTVKSWEFTNPHSWLVLMIVKNGRPTEVNIEGASVLTLVRQGFGLNTFVPGEKVNL